MIVFIVTFTLFFIEAILHYNYGSEQKGFKSPNKQEFLQIVITVGVFSYANSRLLKYLSKHYHLHS